MRQRSVVLRDLAVFARTCGVTLRLYQLEALGAIVEAVKGGGGKTFAVMMARQSGKNEVSAVLEAYLLVMFSRVGGQVVKASPTFQPQVVNSMLRLTQRFPKWAELRRREGYIFECGAARCLFMSAAPGANVVGATASLLLECDEAQDVDPVKWRKDFLPMAASTNATVVYWGTAWTDKTLLAETVRGLRVVEGRTGERRVFEADAVRVGAEVPAYAAYVASQVEALGRGHPLVKTQYYLETVDAAGGLFDEARQIRMRGTHVRPRGPVVGALYLLLVDVGGAEESAVGDGVARAMNAKRDATAATVVEVVFGAGPLPTYKVADRRSWVGAGHASLHAQLVDLAQLWGVGRVIVDATGLGSGLAQFLSVTLGEARVLQFVFTSASKSSLGWRFLGIVETGRWQEYAEDGRPETRQFWYEVGACEYEVSRGGLLKWGVSEGVRYDGLVAKGHDDLLLSAALVAAWEEEQAFSVGERAVIERELTDVTKVGF
jgi:hypothetical protein